MKKLLCSMVLLFSVGAVCAQPPVAGEKIPADPEVRMGRLDNGMAYYIRHNAKPEGMADFYIVHNVGAVQEEDSQAGLAHFLEHLAFNGTTNLPGKTMINWTERVGLKVGQNLNASTGMERTSYMISNVPLTRESIIDSALLVLHDWSGSIELKEKEIDAERGVIIEERRGINNAGRRIMTKTMPALYGGTRFGERDMIGSEQQLRTFPYRELRDFYKRWYRPDLQAIIVVGDFDADMMEAKVKKMMSKIPAAAHPAPKQYFPIPVNVAPTVTVVTDPEMTYSNATLYIKHRQTPLEERNTVAAVYKNELIKAGVSMTNSRLTEIAQQPEPPFNAAQLSWMELNDTDKALSIGVNGKENLLPEAFEAAYTELERVRHHGFTQPELDIAKANLLNEYTNNFAGRNDRDNGHFVRSYINNFTDNTAIPSAEYNYEMGQRLVAQMTLAQVNEAFRSLLTPTNNVIIAVTPEKEGVTVPTADAFLAAITRAREANLAPYTPSVITEPLISATIEPGKVKKEEQGMFGSTVWTLGNGARVVVKPSDLRANNVMMKTYALGGKTMLGDDDSFTADMIKKVAEESGLGKFTASELRKQLAGKTAKASVGLGRFSSGVEGSSSTKDIETMLQLMWLWYNEPQFDREQFDRLMAQTRVALQNAESTPKFRFDEERIKTLNDNNPRADQMSLANIDRVDFDRMPEIYDRLFGGTADDYTFFFVGDLDLETFKPLVEKYIGSLPSKGGKLALKDDGIHRHKGAVTNRFETKMEVPKSTVYYTWGGDIDFTLENDLAMKFLSEILNMRYFQSIREEKGGTYGVGVGGYLIRLPEPSYELSVMFDTDPSMVDELAAIVDAELLEIAENGPSKDDMAKVRENLEKSRPATLKDNAKWMGFLQDYYIWEQDWVAGWDQALASTDSAKVQALARKIVADGNLVKLIMSPEK
jgi:zinc protease